MVGLSSNGDYHARVFEVESKPGKSQDARNAFEENILPALKNHPWYRGCQVLSREGSRRVIFITWWYNCAQPLAYFNENVQGISDTLDGIDFDVTRFDVQYEDPPGLILEGNYIPGDG
jgi:hypothetical protein